MHRVSLQRVDRCSMRHQVETREPFLDPAVVNYALGLKASALVREVNGIPTGKMALREIYDLYPGQLPASIRDRGKMPFGEGAGLDVSPQDSAWKRRFDAAISDRDLRDGQKEFAAFNIQTKEELFYLRKLAQTIDVNRVPHLRDRAWISFSVEQHREKLKAYAHAQPVSATPQAPPDRQKLPAGGRKGLPAGPAHSPKSLKYNQLFLWHGGCKVLSTGSSAPPVGAVAWCDCGEKVMGLFDALSSAVSGLQGQSFAMQNISGNIANSQTIAYKAIDTNFSDLIPGDSPPSQQVAGGVIASSDRRNSVQGTIQGTSSAPTWRSMATAIFGVQDADQLSSRLRREIRQRRQLHPARRFPARRTMAIWSTAAAIISKASRSTRRPAIRPAPCAGAAAIPNTISCRPARRRTIKYGINLPALSANHECLHNRRQFRTAQPADFAGDQYRWRRRNREGRRPGCDRPSSMNRSMADRSPAMTATGNAGQSATALGQDRQRRHRRHRYMGAILSDRFHRDERHRRSPGKMPGQSFTFNSSGQAHPAVTNVSADRRQ